MYQQFIETQLGKILVKANQTGITHVQFINDLNISNLSQNVSVHTKLCCQELQQYFEGKRTNFETPLCFNGTTFQQNVWNQLLKIPFGNTISYLELAIKLGNKNAIRAVGTANGKNNIAIIIPCHRVVGSGGKLIGYAGGLHRKQWLLNHENKNQLLF